MVISQRSALEIQKAGATTDRRAAQLPALQRAWNITLRILNMHSSQAYELVVFIYAKYHVTMSVSP
jgi:hypothetical protein